MLQLNCVSFFGILRKCEREPERGKEKLLLLANDLFVFRFVCSRATQKKFIESKIIFSNRFSAFFLFFHSLIFQEIKLEILVIDFLIFLLFLLHIVEFRLWEADEEQLPFGFNDLKCLQNDFYEHEVHCGIVI